jgi:hypothetical protein
MSGASIIDAKIDKAVASKHLLDSAAKNIRALLAGAESDRG